MEELELDSLDFENGNLVDHKFDPDSVTSSEKFEFGAADETMIGGNLLRYGQAFLDSVSDKDMTMEEAILNIENKRQRDVYFNNPKFFGIEQDQEDAAIIAGRVGTAIVDPVPWLMPWTRVEKVGKLAGAGFGAAFSGADAALRDKVLYGEVDPINTSISALVGGGAGAISAAIRQRLGRNVDEIDELVESPEAAQRIPAEADDISQALPEVTEETDKVIAPSMREVIRAYQRQQWWGEPAPIEVTSESPIRDLIRAHNRRLGGYNQPLPDQERVALERATAKVINSEEVDKARTKEAPLSYVPQPIVEAKRIALALEKKVKAASKADKPELERQYDQAIENVKKAQKKYFDTQLDVAVTKADKTGAILEELNSTGELSNNLYSKILYEGTRPIVGGLGGFAASGIVGDEDDDATTIGLILGGAAIGRYHNVIRRSNLTAIQKESGRLMIDEGAGRNIRTMVKMHSAGTLATKLDAMGGYAKVLGNMLLQRPNSSTDSVEARAIRETRKYLSSLNDTLGDAADDMNTRKLIGQIVNGFDLEDIKVGYKGMDGTLDPLTAEQIADARRLAPLVAKQRDELADTVKQVGIKFKDLGDNYGMAQLYNMDTIGKNLDEFESILKDALRIEKPKLKEDELNKATKKFLSDLTGDKGYEGSVRITKDNLFGDGRFRPLADHFEKHRLLENPEARKLLARNGYINLDAQEVFSVYADRTIKGREFARTFGANGELIEHMFNKVDESFLEAGASKQEFGETYKKYLYDTLDAFWGSYGGADKATIKAGQIGLPLLTTLANATYLTRVTITSLGDLIQPFQNSGFGAATKAIFQKAGKNPSFSRQAGFKYDLGWEREYSALMTQGGDPLSSYQKRLNNFNKRFFEVVGLSTLTKVARGFAYDVGVNRAFDISRKTKLSSGIREEMKGIGLSDANIKVLKKYKTVQEAYKSEDGSAILDRVGQKMSDRDAIVPTVGNRLLFTQSRNPYVRSLGQFLSWAQAKTSQTNSLIERVENGDAALALRTLTLTGIYGAVQGLREYASPTYDPYKDKYSDDLRGQMQFAKKSMELSGNYLPWQIDKLLRTYESAKRGEFVSGLTPSASYAESLVGSLLAISSDLAEGDVEEAVLDASRVTPFAREIIGYGERLGFDMPEQRRDKREKGGEVDIPGASSEPDERIDRMTGMPYDQQAGTAFIDEEDPLRRLGFVGGGEIDPLRRLGFGSGGKVLNALRRASV